MGKKKNNDTTLLAFIETLDPKTIVYIGADAGSNWLAIDTAENLIDDLGFINTIVRDNVVDSYHKTRQTMKKLPKTIVDMELKIDEENHPWDAKELREKIEHCYKSFAYQYGRAEKLKEYINNWIDLGLRKVVKVYDHTVKPIGVCVTIEGTETGQFWMKNEYDEFKTKHKK